MRFLITGGMGFIGSHLAAHLHRQGHYVRVLDDMSSGSQVQFSPDIFVKRGDVRDVPNIWPLLHGIDVVYHLAARVSVPASILYPREYNDVNVGGTVALLEACRDVGVGRVVLASSATVYGRQTEQPVTEETPVKPAVPYAVSKVAAEHYLFAMGQLVGFETVSLRIFNAYGPGQALPPTHAPVIPYVMRQVDQNASVVINGDGSQSRDFVYIDDVVEALAAAATAPNIDGQTINVGSGQETTINQLAQIIGEVVGKKPNLLHNQENSGGVDRLVADLHKAADLLNFQPKVSLKKGLQNLYRQDPNFRK
ncbi:MAG: NAD-dependent epimerase/dehydratase family protein [Caldilineaceae bacterium]|nr:NAD-dependent epimerase/dehydratase family protein [Caldilineaceae bacterium]